MDGNGVMGKITIDRPLLNRLLLKVHKDGKQIAYQPVPHDLVELLTKKYNTRKQYHPDAVQLFQKLIRHSEIPFDKVRNAKFKNILSNMHESASGKDIPMSESAKQQTSPSGEGCSCEEKSITILDSPEDAFKRLNILLGEISAGNTNESVKNEAGQLLEYLHKHGEITSDGYTQLMKGCGIIE